MVRADCARQVILPFPQPEHVGMIGLTEPTGRLDNPVEDRLHFGWRTADNIEHLARRSLLLQRFLQLARSRLHLLEQPRVLDGDHGLVGEGLEQIDLPISEQSYFGASDQERSNCLFCVD